MKLYFLFFSFFLHSHGVHDLCFHLDIHASMLYQHEGMTVLVCLYVVVVSSMYH